MTKALTETQEVIVTKLKTIDNDPGWVIGMALAASVYGFEEELLDYLKGSDSLTGDEVSEWVFERVPDEEE